MLTFQTYIFFIPSFRTFASSLLFCKVTHCYNSFTLLEVKISQTFPREARKHHFWYQTNSRRASSMASIYKKPPHFVLKKTWDKKTKLPETYKLQSNDSWNKIKAKVHQDSGKLGVEFTKRG